MADETPFSKTELLRRIKQGWDEFNTYINSLTEQQLTIPTDAAGWTAKDHIIHLAVWEGGVLALLRGENRREYMGVDEESWNSRDFDRMNEIIRQHHKDKTASDVLNTFRDVHRQMMEKLDSIAEADFTRPYRHYDPASPREEPVVNWIVGDTYEHYAEHQTWIAAIVNPVSSGD